MTEHEIYGVINRKLVPFLSTPYKTLLAAAIRDEANFCNAASNVFVFDYNMVYSMGDNQPDDLLKVFKYVFKMTVEICDQNNIPRDYGFDVAESFLDYKHEKTLGQKTFWEIIDAAKKHVEERLSREAELYKTMFKEAREHCAVIADGNRSLMIDCNLCVMRPNCARETPDDCYAIDSARGIDGSRNVSGRPYKYNKGFKMELVPGTFNKPGIYDQLVGLQNYFQKEK